MGRRTQRVHGRSLFMRERNLSLLKKSIVPMLKAFLLAYDSPFFFAFLLVFPNEKNEEKHCIFLFVALIM